MNKYVKKCLAVYSVLAFILVGMAGVTYAVTATDADQYVTRSQFAVDMAHLQNKLDEQEAGLMGNINRYRSTDIKFVTYDMPEYPGAGQEFTGGNYFPAIRKSGGRNYRGVFLGVENENSANGRYAVNRYVSLHRLWNGNYYITTDKMRSIGSSSVQYHGAAYYCAVPCENLPGYYLTIMYYDQDYSANYLRTRFALNKLDRSCPTLSAAEISAAGPLKFRFKKNLWAYWNNKWNDTNFTQSLTSIAFAYYTGVPAPFTGVYIQNNSATGNDTIRCRRYIDPDSGDYIIEMQGLKNDNAQNVYAYVYYTNSQIPLLPKDNVEYLMVGPVGWTSNQVGIGFAPPSMTIATSVGHDNRWDYEFVDCENGIKYFHGYKRPDNVSGWWVLGWHYSLPIVY